MLKIKWTSTFKSDYKKIKKQGILIDDDLSEVLEILQRGGALPEKNRDHSLRNSRLYKNMRECHVKPDVLLVYKIINNKLILELIRLGSHSELKL